MRIRWRNFELPSQVRMDQDTATSQFGRFVVEPFEKGFGATIGNGLRRVLLSSIEGTAVTWVRIDGVVHEFSTIQGVLEDVTQIVLNIKKLRVKLHTDAPTTLRIDVNQKGEVRAEKIEGDHNVEIANPELKICTLTEDVRFYCEMQVKKGRGYVTAEENVMAALMFSGVPRGEHRERARGLLKRLGMVKYGSMAESLSVGQQQRVAVARAVACGPRLVLADEPTASLDPDSGRAAMDLVQGVCQEIGAALVCVSHDPSMATRFERRERLEDLSRGNEPRAAHGDRHVRTADAARAGA